MPKKLRAKFANGVLVPLDELDLEEGAEITLSIDDAPQLSPEERAEKMKSTAGVWTEQEDLEKIRRALRGPRLSTNEWLKKVRKRRDASQARITAAETLEMRDADRK